MVFAVFSASAALLIPRTLFGIFTSDQAVIDYGVTYMSIIAVSYFVSAFCSSFKALITGAGEVILGLFVGILDGVICRIGISLFCVYVLDLGATGYFWGTALCQVVPGIVCLGYFVSGKWRTKKLLVNSKQP
jgi:Na+-driven multidrug efflux pump